ncbi:DUF6241 domain-containing protein [Lysinibacillus sp. NPDC097287]|uniref:DUF6241 domain-containing protein n=1 Tax=Lysinibacillus sp. NPDC097287 TaxID=3364144 RepID=UPI0038153D0C
MAHQKIIADENESSIMITPGKFTLCYEWSRKIQGDFTSVDDDHNVMWLIQGIKRGGAATGIAAEEQEINYLLEFSII